MNGVGKSVKNLIMSRCYRWHIWNTVADDMWEGFGVGITMAVSTGR